jgi:hypothetical protein
LFLLLCAAPPPVLFINARFLTKLLLHYAFSLADRADGAVDGALLSISRLPKIAVIITAPSILIHTFTQI